ncbi:MAG: methyltransferase domain-containing protein [Dehalococcoidales bacterium]|nr:methyltransferase domain-containing protein [Dehalococcoidales bacterium]MDP6737691.1 methyltransferase domain-containing protein [Dehalococcoidales bacterium]
MINIFDEVAPSWYNLRHRSIFRWELEELAQRWQTGNLLNIGCAHGPDFLPFVSSRLGGIDLTGVDFSAQMLRFARKYSMKFGFVANLVLADVRYLPFADGVFDQAISVATYHHIPGKMERLAALEELRRVLKPGGEAFITVWNRWQPRFWRQGREVTVPWRTKVKTLERYYYLFSYPELVRLARQSGLEVLRSYPESTYHFPFKFFSRNICLLVRKSD